MRHPSETRSRGRSVLVSSRPRSGHHAAACQPYRFLPSFAKHLQPLLELVIRLTHDPDLVVVEAAYWALSQLAEYVAPPILAHYDVILPALTAGLAHTDSLVLQRVATVIECYVDGLAAHIIAQHLPSLLPALGAALVRPDQPFVVQEMVVSAVASIASASDHRMMPYLEGLVAVLSPLVLATDDTLLRLRACAIECMAYVAVAVGKAAFAPYLPPLMTAARDSMQFDYLELSEKTFTTFAILAECYGADFAEYVPMVLAAALATVRQNATMLLHSREDHDLFAMEARLTGAVANEDDEREVAGPSAVGSGDGDEDGTGDGGGTAAAAADGDDDDDDDGGEGDDDGDSDDGVMDDPGVRVKLHMGEAELKVAAAKCVGLVARHCPHAFAPHLEGATNLFLRMTSHVVQEMEETAVSALTNFVRARIELDPLIPPPCGVGPPCLTAASQAYYDQVITSFIRVMAGSRNRAVVGTACLGIQEFCKMMGYAAVEAHHRAIVNELCVIGREKALCQTTDDDGEGGLLEVSAVTRTEGEAPAAEGDDDDGEHDELREHDVQLIDEATDAAIQVMIALGDVATLYLPRIVKVWRRFTKPSRPSFDRLMAIGMFADLIDGVGSLMEPHLPEILSIAFDALGSSERDVQRNAVFCLGIAAAKFPDFCKPTISHFLAALYPFLSLKRGKASIDTLLDNVVAAAARIMMAIPTAVTPASAVPAMVELLPLRADLVENRTVYSCLLALLEAQEPAAVAAIPKLIPALVETLADESMLARPVAATVVAPRLRNFLATATPEAAAAYTAAVDSCSEGGRAALAAILAA